MTEGAYQRTLIIKIKKKFPDIIVLKNDPTYLQGFPDLLLLKGNKWAALEIKKDAQAHHQPNQEHYINYCRSIGSYASFVFPQNEEEILDELERSFKS